MIISFIFWIIISIIVSLLVYFIIRFLECDLDQFPALTKLPGYGLLNKDCAVKQLESKQALTAAEQKIFRDNKNELILYIKNQIKNNSKYKTEYQQTLNIISQNIEIVISGKEELLYTQLQQLPENKREYKIDYNPNKLYLTELNGNSNIIKLNLGNKKTEVTNQPFNIEIDFTNYINKISESNNLISKVITPNVYHLLGKQHLSIYYNDNEAFTIRDSNSNSNSESTGPSEKLSLKALLREANVGRYFSILDRAYTFIKNILPVLNIENWKDSNPYAQGIKSPIALAKEMNEFYIDTVNELNDNYGKNQKVGIVTYGKWFYNAEQVDPNFEHLISEYKKAIPNLKNNDNFKITIKTLQYYDGRISDILGDSQQEDLLVGAAQEGLLDLGIILDCCPAISEVVIICSGNNLLEIHEMVEYAHNNNINVLNISWGSNTQKSSLFEDAYSFNNYYKRITICAASGDWGGLGTDDKKPNNTLTPASSPYVLACGGTQNSNIASNTTINNIIHHAANQDEVWIGSGGGFNPVSTRPEWQNNYFNFLQNNNLLNQGKSYDYLFLKDSRLVPDIAGMAQDNWLFPVFFNDPDDNIPNSNIDPPLIGGTSAVAPLYSALFVLINQKRAALNKTQFGFANEKIYQLAKDSLQNTLQNKPNKFNNYFKSFENGVTKGGHTGNKYYNLATGIGQLRFNKFIEWAVQQNIT